MAKKKKSKFSRKFQKNIQAKRRDALGISNSQQQLVQRYENHAAREERDVVIDTSNPQKMSDIIIDYAEPLLGVAETGKEQEKAVIMAITLWNLAILKENGRQDMFDSLVPQLMQECDPAAFNETMEYFIERKQQLYPGLNRMILDYDCVHTSNRLHLNVVSNSLD